MQVSGISASMSMTLAIEAGMGSYNGVGAAVTTDGAGSEATRAAAIDVATFFFSILSRSILYKKINHSLVHNT